MNAWEMINTRCRTKSRSPHYRMLLCAVRAGAHGDAVLVVADALVRLRRMGSAWLKAASVELVEGLVVIKKDKCVLRLRTYGAA